MCMYKLDNHKEQAGVRDLSETLQKLSAALRELLTVACGRLSFTTIQRVSGHNIMEKQERENGNGNQKWKLETAIQAT